MLSAQAKHNVTNNPGSPYIEGFGHALPGNFEKLEAKWCIFARSGNVHGRLTHKEGGICISPKLEQIFPPELQKNGRRLSAEGILATWKPLYMHK